MSDDKESKLERIKKEAREDASSYYAQGDKSGASDLKSEYAKPLPPVDTATEEFNLVRTLSYLAFGGAALALVFILFFIRDLDKRVDHVGKEVVDMAPFKKEVGDNLAKLNGDVEKLKGRVDQYEKATMIMELKRAMATVLAVSESNDELKTKSTPVVASIQTLLSDLEGGANTPAPITGSAAIPAPGAKPAETPPATPASEATPAASPAAVAPATDATPAATPAAGAPTSPDAQAKPAENVTPPPATVAVTPPVAPADAKPAGAKKASKGDDEDDEDDD